MTATGQELYLRADASTEIGTGHLMRSLALGQAWQDRGGKVVFLSHCDHAELAQRIIQEGFNFIPIAKPHPDPADLQMTLQQLQSRAPRALSPPWLAIDGYHFTPDFMEAVRQAQVKVLVIDDYNHHPSYHADFLLNQNINSQLFPYRTDPDTVRLLGPTYALLRREFVASKPAPRGAPEVAHRLLVTMGGSDPGNATGKIIASLQQVPLDTLQVRIIVGPANPFLEHLSRDLARVSFRYEVFLAVKNMAEMIYWPDIAITGGGSTCWELAFAGVPMVVFTLAENQRRVASGLHDLGAAINLAWIEEAGLDQISATLTNLMVNQAQRRAMAARGAQLVDGLGAGRVVSRMMEARL